MLTPPILVVDHEPAIRALMARTLEQNGYQVDFAASGPEAIRKFGGDRFSLVITGDRLPEGSGLDVLTSIKRISPQCPVIMLTDHGSIGHAVEAMQEGASDYILKPFAPETIQSAVKKVMGNGAPRCGTGPVDGAPRLVTRDPQFEKLLALARRIAPSSAIVLIQGESGTGKEVLARYIHAHRGKDHGPYMAVNCAALPDNLAESELFGYEKGAFTGAVSRKKGKFEAADQGTLVLDEIGEMSLPLQAKLLRAIQEKEIDRVGGTQPVPVNTRVIAVTNVDLKSAVREGRFREDLYYRINVIPLTIPPLRERRGDIIPLAEHFIGKFSQVNALTPMPLSPEAKELLLRNEWRGNVRELQNTVERAVLLCMEDRITPDHLLFEDGPLSTPPTPQIPIRAGVTVRDMERDLILHTLKEVNNNRTHAADLLGISIRTLRNKLREYRELGEFAD